MARSTCFHTESGAFSTCMCAFLQLEHQAFPLQNLLWDVAHDGHSTPDVTISPRVVTKPKVASIENTGLVSTRAAPPAIRITLQVPRCSHPPTGQKRKQRPKVWGTWLLCPWRSDSEPQPGHSQLLGTLGELGLEPQVLGIHHQDSSKK